MSRRVCRVREGSERLLVPECRECPECGRRMRIRYENRRAVLTLSGLDRLRLKIQRCENPACARRHRPYRPEAEGAVALPHHEFGLDVIALIGALRHRAHRSVPEIHAALCERGLMISERSVTNLLDRYDELVATALDAPSRAAVAAQGRVILAHLLLSGTQADLAGLLRDVTAALEVPVAGVVSDGQHSIRRAVAEALPGVPHQLCQFHYLREAARPLFEADRHAKKELKKTVRGVRPIERRSDGQDDGGAPVVAGYRAAVRSALTDDGRPPLAAPGLTLKGRLEAIAGSLDRVEQKGG